MDDEVIQAIRSCPELTKQNMKKLNKIFNSETGATYEYCMCSKGERERFFNYFFKWYDNKTGR